MSSLTFEGLTDFTFKSYRKLLRYLTSTYQVIPFCEVSKVKDTPYLILRHDVDQTLLRALKMAQIERDLGVRSTYFVLFSSRWYNLLEGNNVSILRKISNLGHEIGLHYDTVQYRSYGPDAKQTLKMEIHMLENVLRRKVYTISRHNPLGKTPFMIVKGHISAEDPRLNDLLITDACRAWDPLEGLLRLFVDPPKRVQLLVHPCLWHEKKLRDRYVILEMLFQNFVKEKKSYRERLERSWSTLPPVIKYDYMIENMTEKDVFMQLHQQHYRQYKLISTVESKLPKFLRYYYRTAFHWYLHNTTLGWYLNRLKKKIYSKLNMRAVRK